VWLRRYPGGHTDRQAYRHTDILITIIRNYNSYLYCTLYKLTEGASYILVGVMTSSVIITLNISYVMIYDSSIMKMIMVL